jgi:PadR family transcriptional regulator, regulatory protein PadR
MEQHKNEVLPGTLNLMVLKTLSTLGSLHGYGIARRIEQVSGDRLQLNQGTIYPALLHLEQMGWISSEWGVSENNRRAKYYSITRAGKKQLAAEEEYWRQTSEIMIRFLEPSEEGA